jgi:predicted O-linked N-acetylglucosamine transferase (SPINDLY family)
MVFCCFNGLHKITPNTWERWMRILHQTPNSVLWLLDGIESTNNRLRELFVQAGLASERLIFAKKASNSEHLCRYPLADLFLDTAPYGAHTTSSDALWMGVPVITFPGRSFASRVCGSLLTAVGLPDLICDSPEKFVALAVELGTDRAKLLEYRRRLADSREACTLFDTPRLVRGLEDLYEQMWKDYESGSLPVPDLGNLEIYNDIGCELDSGDVEFQTISDYRERYLAKLAEKDEFWGVPTDNRLWTVEAQRRYRKT